MVTIREINQKIQDRETAIARLNREISALKAHRTRRRRAAARKAWATRKRNAHIKTIRLPHGDFNVIPMADGADQPGA